MGAVSNSQPQTDKPNTLQGTCVDASDEMQLRQAIDVAFNYRGDVTLTRKGESEPIEGFVFDRHERDNLEDCVLRIMPRNDSGRLSISYDNINTLRFSGKDTAAGKSFDTWMKKYVEKKLAGQQASIESEPLD